MTGSAEKGITALEEKHLISIMMYLSLRGECRKIDIYDNVSSNPRIPEKLDRLESLGLLIQKADTNSRSILIQLTEKGSQVAKNLLELDRIIKSE